MFEIHGKMKPLLFSLFPVKANSFSTLLAYSASIFTKICSEGLAVLILPAHC
jgi:hypothetical protein